MRLYATTAKGPVHHAQRPNPKSLTGGIKLTMAYRVAVPARHAT
jgi:hypothetical protein